MKNKLNLIKLKRGKGIELAKVFGCTPARVSQALNGLSPKNELTIKIRHVAITQFDGEEMTTLVNKKSASATPNT